MSIARSVSVEDLTKAASNAAERVLADRLKDIGGGKAQIGLFPDIGTIGIILRDYDLRRADVPVMMEMSAKITASMGDLAIDAVPTVQFIKDIATLGYFPPDPVILKDLR